MLSAKAGEKTLPTAAQATKESSSQTAFGCVQINFCVMCSGDISFLLSPRRFFYFPAEYSHDCMGPSEPEKGGHLYESWSLITQLLLDKKIKGLPDTGGAFEEPLQAFSFPVQCSRALPSAPVMDGPGPCMHMQAEQPPAWQSFPPARGGCSQPSWTLAACPEKVHLHLSVEGKSQHLPSADEGELMKFPLQ